ncbi:MAG: hypothetical protein LBQ37_00575 [Elusimicrobiota bacterium]|jgi:hypothetical protein|nr:hypothetical protein [Elusimicrobiota bacterium]
MKKILINILMFNFLFLVSAVPALAADDYDSRLAAAMGKNKQEAVKKKQDAIKKREASWQSISVLTSLPLFFSREKVGDDEEVKSSVLSVTAGVEYMIKIIPAIKLGIGAQYGVFRLETEIGRYYSTTEFIPIYAGIKIMPLSINRGFFFFANFGRSIYASYADLGKNYFYQKSSGGSYWAGGVGYETVSGLVFGVSYHSYSYTLEDGDESYFTKDNLDVTIERLMITLGYSFNL